MERLSIFNEDGVDTGKVIVRGVDELMDNEYILAAVMVICVGDKILITKRAEGKSCAGKWEFPGGAVLSNEKSIEGGMRELKEETGLHVDQKKFCYLGQLISKEEKLLMDIYKVDVNPHLKLNDVKLQKGETCEAKIVSVNQIDEMYNRLTKLDQMIFDEFAICMDDSIY